jgi:acetylornithine deacetylase
MKAGLVAELAALAAIRSSGARLRGQVAAHVVVGEEDGGLGAFGTLRRGHTGDACIIAETTGGTLLTANAGALTFRIEVSGKPTHAGTRRAGVSAIDAYLPIHAALARLEAKRNTDVDPVLAEHQLPYALCVGRLRSGDWVSSVPGLLVVEGRLGVRLDEDPADARAALEGRVAEVCAEDPWLRANPAVVSRSGGQFASGRLPAGHPLRDVVRKAHQDATKEPGPRESGAPYGPGEVSVAHSPYERVSVAETVRAARTLTLAALRAAGAD